MQHKLIKNTLIVLACSLLAKVLAYVWEAILAAYLGANDTSDALYMTMSVFNVLYPILDIGIWKVFMPAYQSKRSDGRQEEADKLANGTITFFLLLSVALVGFLIVFAGPLISLFAPGFAPEKQQLTVQFLRISAPAYFLMAAASILGAILQCHDKFLGSQIREIGTHLSKIVYVFLCFRFFGVYAAVTAIIIGSIFRTLIQLPFFNWGWRWRPSFNFKDRDIKQMLRGLPSVAVTAAILHINSLVDRIFASGAVKGAVSCLNYGNRLMTVFSGMISTAISTATYPTMIDHIAQKRVSKLTELVVKTVHAMVFFIVPLTLFCALFSREIVTVAFQRGAFDETASALTAAVFVGYSLGMLFTALETVLSNVFYAYGDTKTSLYISMITIALNVVLDFLFYRWFDVPGLAIATSTAATLGLMLRLVFLRRYLKLPYRRILLELVKILFSAALPVLGAWYCFTRLLSLSDFVTLLLSFLTAAAAYLLLAALFRSEAMRDFVRLVKKKLRSLKKST